jgi:tetrahydromethanopterin S-methyltransferase subunit H
MFQFKEKQKIFDIGGVKVGGQPGEVPTVIISSIFYLGHKIVSDEKKGIFDKKKAEELIKNNERLSDLTTNPFMLEVVAQTEEALTRLIDFTAETTDVPFLISALSSKVLMSGAQHVAEVGLQDRIVYSSIPKGTTSKELEAIKNSGIKAAILLGRNPMDEYSAKGKVEVVKDVLKLSEKAKIEKPLIDVATEGFGISMGAAARAIYLIKSAYGYPVGIGTGNVTTTFDWAKTNVAKKDRRACYGSIHAIMQILGADFIMHGPIEQADYVFPTVAMTDTYILTAMGELGIEPIEEGNHPLFKLITF